MGRIAVLLVVAAAALMPALGTAAPGNPIAELKREDVKFQGMYAQLDNWRCNTATEAQLNNESPNFINFDALLQNLNNRRRAAFVNRRQSYPGDFSFSCGDDDDDDGAPEIRQR